MIAADEAGGTRVALWAHGAPGHPLELSALATRGILAALVPGLIAYEAIHFAHVRAPIRHAA